MCAWCQKVGIKRYSLSMGSEVKSFCSEKCFAACRRAYFKRNKVSHLSEAAGHLVRMRLLALAGHTVALPPACFDFCFVCFFLSCLTFCNKKPQPNVTCPSVSCGLVFEF